jgi:hypothetical protein
MRELSQKIDIEIRTWRVLDGKDLILTFIPFALLTRIFITNCFKAAYSNLIRLK